MIILLFVVVHISNFNLYIVYDGFYLSINDINKNPYLILFFTLPKSFLSGLESGWVVPFSQMLRIMERFSDFGFC